jgi:excisionase family DNA binding protein
VSSLIAVPLPDGRWLALTPDALRAALDAALALGLGPSASPAGSTAAGASFERLVDSEELGKLLGVHSTTVEGLAKAGTIPSIRCGKALRFEPSTVKAALKARTTCRPAR